MAEKVENVRKWIVDQEEAQAAMDPWDEPAFKSADVPKQTKDLEALIGRLSKKPKPKKEEKKENKTEAADGETEDLDDKSEAKAEETPKEETKETDEGEL